MQISSSYIDTLLMANYLCDARGLAKTLIFQQLGVPIGNIDGIEKGHPFLVAGHAEGFLHERRPLRFKRFTYQRHTGLVWGSTAFVVVALMTRADDVLPNRGAALGAGYDMVEIEFLTWPAPATILTGAFVTGVNIIAAKTDLAFRDAVIGHQQNHPGNSNDAVDQPNRLVMCRKRQIAPAREIKGLILLVNGFGNALIEQHKSTTNRGHMDRQIRTIEDENLGVENSERCRGRWKTHNQLSGLKLKLL